MKSERRHELQTNSLAVIIWRAPEFFQKHGTKVLLGVVVVALAVTLIGKRMNQPVQAANEAQEKLVLAQNYLAQLSIPFSDTNRAQLFADARNMITAARDATSDPVIQSRALLTLGDLYLTQASVADEMAMGAELKAAPQVDDRNLDQAAKAYGEVLKLNSGQAYMTAAAHLGLGNVEQVRASGYAFRSGPATDGGASTKPAADALESARTHYRAVVDLPGSLPVQRDIAGRKLQDLSQLAHPVWVIAATQPATLPSSRPAGPLGPEIPEIPATTTAPAGR